ncbi:hypothetical protein TNIN_250301 [Trichonephila inaurata madagascariensis]|uniref:Uncharacterized protein n=1 Tax=Trichonephila inaurata madagascariensis TaxID=2747483 RepID=A0A8X6Y612_9ARAC|nr:hypothetical protein TNIN_250301 [Trichonephila inaurata madagascariensis]
MTFQCAIYTKWRDPTRCIYTPDVQWCNFVTAITVIRASRRFLQVKNEPQASEDVKEKRLLFTFLYKNPSRPTYFCLTVKIIAVTLILCINLANSIPQVNNTSLSAIFDGSGHRLMYLQGSITKIHNQNHELKFSKKCPHAQVYPTL